MAIETSELYKVSGFIHLDRQLYVSNYIKHSKCKYCVCEMQCI